MIAIIDYGMGNLRSVANALDFIGADFLITHDKELLKQADKIILPGVGAFRDGIENLKSLNLDDVLREEVMVHQKPLLGICLGMQMLAEKGYEGGEHQGLGLIKGVVQKLEAQGRGLRVPHVGWDDITYKKDNPLFCQIPDHADFYFVHSYHLVCGDAKDIVATCTYGLEFVAVIQHENIFATQFHPEKSQENGLQVLMNFVDYNYVKNKIDSHSLA